ncbi:unnamed protein product [Albugo candida]|uniref:Uncharacterized protein n=1 Tax=Albugo candida TaxID=65357 RepID=A0A024FU04_9STRA|nr:unnamed protein product [Albugo candida]|eukprot:CCI10149.1 unnamed protein product [Albugo candida]
MKERSWCNFPPLTIFIFIGTDLVFPLSFQVISLEHCNFSVTMQSYVDFSYDTLYLIFAQYAHPSRYIITWSSHHQVASLVQWQPLFRGTHDVWIFIVLRLTKCHWQCS